MGMMFACWASSPQAVVAADPVEHCSTSAGSGQDVGGKRIANEGLGISFLLPDGYHPQRYLFRDTEFFGIENDAHEWILILRHDKTDGNERYLAGATNEQAVRTWAEDQGEAQGVFTAWEGPNLPGASFWGTTVATKSHVSDDPAPIVAQARYMAFLGCQGKRWSVSASDSAHPWFNHDTGSWEIQKFDDDPELADAVARSIREL
ncbi:hypothetical protein HMPREF9336_02306 [Segniliparus rugosus ATCC BAA-974]|uniref:Uncharacterized protein n=2 Tax=Segniliparus rugosus TaxID=286804 RepID=E5XS34_SEGRC|nr:hypothetical protein HMPREF9336_02306 [Segniliparus rugosus ATCC BAA-974]